MIKMQELIKFFVLKQCYNCKDLINQENISFNDQNITEKFNEFTTEYFNLESTCYIEIYERNNDNSTVICKKCYKRAFNLFFKDFFDSISIFLILI